MSGPDLKHALHVLFWVVATVVVLVTSLYNAVWVVFAYSAAANIISAIGEWQAAKAKRAAEDNGP
jgi:hypothetical protein